ncbi:TPA: MarR family winged helix-turn-helix transcriptional regulator [Klebsiella pneumoniae]
MDTHDKRYIFLLNIAQKSLQRHIESSITDAHGLTAVQAGALFILQHQDGLLIGEVADALNIAASAMTSLSDRMARSGLISKQPDIHDKRSNRLWMTDPGREAAIMAKKQLIPVNARLKEGFSEEEMVVVARWLESIPPRFPS